MSAFIYLLRATFLPCTQVNLAAQARLGWRRYLHRQPLVPAAGGQKVSTASSGSACRPRPQVDSAVSCELPIPTCCSFYLNYTLRLSQSALVLMHQIRQIYCTARRNSLRATDLQLLYCTGAASPMPRQAAGQHSPPAPGKGYACKAAPMPDPQKTGGRAIVSLLHLVARDTQSLAPHAHTPHGLFAGRAPYKTAKTNAS